MQGWQAVMPFNAELVTDLGLDQTIPAEVNGRRNGVNNDPAWDEDYLPCPEAYPAESVPAVHRDSQKKAKSSAE